MPRCWPATFRGESYGLVLAWAEMHAGELVYERLRTGVWPAQSQAA
jgi:hypothetical protein